MGVCAGAWLGGDEGSVTGVCVGDWLGGDEGSVMGVCVGAWLGGDECALSSCSFPPSLSLFISGSCNWF